MTTKFGSKLKMDSALMTLSLQKVELRYSSEIYPIESEINQKKLLKFQVLTRFAFGITHLAPKNKKELGCYKVETLGNMTPCNLTNLKWFPTIPAVPTTKYCFIRLEKQQREIYFYKRFKPRYAKKIVLKCHLMFGYQICFFSGRCLHKIKFRHFWILRTAPYKGNRQMDTLRGYARIIPRVPSKGAQTL